MYKRQMYNIPSAFVRFLGPYVGYSLGAKFMSSAAENGIMSFITKAASTVGLMKMCIRDSYNRDQKIRLLIIETSRKKGESGLLFYFP